MLRYDFAFCRHRVVSHSHARYIMLASPQEWDSHTAPHSKRQRRVTEDRTMSASFDDFQSRDYYQEILEGVGLGQVYNSWLRDIRPIACLNEATSDNFGIHGMSMSIRSVSQQLLQVKRKLWPAAERCALAVYQRTGYQSSPHVEFSEARRSCNPMECLGEGKANGLNQHFMNRSAIKLANIDAILDFRLTSCPPSSPFTFVDLCGAPGGFSEYLMMRSQEFHDLHTRGTIPGSCRGYGMSLLGTNEHGNGTFWKLKDISEWNWNGTFHTKYTICTGVDGTGDIYKWDNVRQLRSNIQSDFLSNGMHGSSKVQLVVADGGFDAQRDSECQEGLAQKLVLSEMAAAVDLLDVGGTFVIKMFGFQSSLVRTAMHSMNDMFHSIQVLKPTSSRPASSERYVVFEGFRGAQGTVDSGSAWLGRVLLGRAAVLPPGSYSSLNTYLDQMDMDILSLNLKACFTILSSLDRKTTDVYASVDGNPDWSQERLPVNIASYKCAWRLG